MSVGEGPSTTESGSSWTHLVFDVFQADRIIDREADQEYVGLRVRQRP